jgi:Rieske Fe-S protein
MEKERRRFLRVIGGAAVTLAVPSCSESNDSPPKAGDGGSDPSGHGSSGSSDASSSSGPTSSSSGMGGASSTSSSSSAAGGSGGKSNCDPPGTSAGAVSQFTNGLYQVTGKKFLIGRDASGLYAMTSICTHQLCNMNKQGSVDAGGIRCTCHMSEFDLNGEVLVGPATKPLNHYAVAIACDGTVWVDTATVVDKSTRIPVP